MIRLHPYAIAAEALTDPRTVRRYLAGERVAGLARERIERAIERLRARHEAREAAR